MPYKHGIYTETVADVGKLGARAAGTIPVYIGTAPITSANAAGKVKTPIMISSYNDFVSAFGYSDDWDTYTLCEVAYAHFKNSVQTIAPFIVINVFDPEAHTSASEVAKADFEDGIAAIDTCAIKCGVVPNIIVMPKYSHTYATELVKKCEELIDGKWGCVAYIDIPTDSVNTIESALTFKTTNKITSKYARLHYPKAKYQGNVFHLSVLDAVVTQIVDTDTDGVSCRSSSNKNVMCDVPVLSETVDLIYSETSANKLNENGITTLNYIGGTFRLWGGHMANYSHASIGDIAAKDRSDATVRMQIYLNNWLKREHIDNIDSPLTRRDIDNIISSVNIGLNSFVNSGYLLKGECYFDEGSNATGDLANGDLVLDVLHTEVPNGKSISFKLAYDVNGLNSLYEAEEV